MPSAIRRSSARRPARTRPPARRPSCRCSASPPPANGSKAWRPRPSPPSVPSARGPAPSRRPPASWPSGGASPSMDRVFVTGASGFVGSAVARALAAEGYRVCALVRSTSRRDNLDLAHLEVIEGDMRDAAAVARGAAGARYVFHVAADFLLCAPHPTEIIRNNTEGTRAVVRAALDAKVERIVHTSSVATLAPGPS